MAKRISRISPSPGTPGEGWGEGSVSTGRMLQIQMNPHPALSQSTGRGNKKNLSRRTFVKTTAALAAAALIPGVAYAGGSDKIRVGMIGCGGRGSGAARDCLRADANIQIVAMGDLFKDRLEGARNTLAKLSAEKFNVAD